MYNNINKVIRQFISSIINTFSGLTTKDYVMLIYTTLSEFPGVFISILMIDTIGRKNTFKVLFSTFTGAILLMIGCSLSKNYLITMLFFARGATAGVLQVVYVYTPEVYPTNLRAVAFGKLLFVDLYIPEGLNKRMQ